MSVVLEYRDKKSFRDREVLKSVGYLRDAQGLLQQSFCRFEEPCRCNCNWRLQGLAERLMPDLQKSIGEARVLL
ncbi:hypothetical protein M758_4G231200 [Ceratodon purpureus]|uniref:Uncharacterized protein n=1 Tax=Ceratodon purpureus TaxID=3225 RepID=A0A8T0IDZ9_CERPU|nr:hypothetical protein KC19_4G225900 [Ceratodon purpureus]KAG0620631.1 hypothetical protein M758_4G231200 [Ceratodon purpureus]